ncbi:hypothetical protein EVAR_84970_1 [Eumeta japonica]|uniref:Mos1 transposase HTH domain-containing protein n=1 Tax=Eumeta variegata TaxID=151549 RepID=A0A4C1VH51_EUMVA|nr:hypothetical protein EVAR_84970_1 [Eumeta japonica]
MGDMKDEGIHLHAVPRDAFDFFEIGIVTASDNGIQSKKETKIESRTSIRLESETGAGIENEKLLLAFYYEVPSLGTVYDWFNEFKRGRINLTDDLREGCPSAATTEDVVFGGRVVCLMIQTDKRLTYQQIS